jgi:hypothetical protein
MSGKGRRVSPLRGGSFRRALRAEVLRRDELPRTAAPAPAAAGPRRNVPGAARRELVAAVGVAPDTPIAGRRSQSPDLPRIVRFGPSSLMGPRPTQRA